MITEITVKRGSDVALLRLVKNLRQRKRREEAISCFVFFRMMLEDGREGRMEKRNGSRTGCQRREFDVFPKVRMTKN